MSKDTRFLSEGKEGTAPAGGVAVEEVRNAENTWEITVGTTGLRPDNDIYWSGGTLDAARIF